MSNFARADFDNNPPIPGRRPEFMIGDASNGIDLVVIYDLMCTDSAYANPEL